MKADPVAARRAFSLVNASTPSWLCVWAAFCSGFAGCSFQPEPSEGLVLHQQDYDFATHPRLPFDAGAAVTDDGGATEVSCKHVAAFTEHVTPRFITHCTECHDGTKIKAVFKLNLFDVEDLSASAQESTCGFTLATANMDALEQSTIFTFLDPSNTATVHDFKFETVDEFTAYRAAVLAWLELEAAPSAP